MYDPPRYCLCGNMLNVDDSNDICPHCINAEMEQENEVADHGYDQLIDFSESVREVEHANVDKYFKIV